jgi:hypothetical protein
MADKQLTQETGEQRHCGHSAKHVTDKQPTQESGEQDS